MDNRSMQTSFLPIERVHATRIHDGAMLRTFTPGGFEAKGKRCEVRFTQNGGKIYLTGVRRRGLGERPWMAGYVRSVMLGVVLAGCYEVFAWKWGGVTPANP